ncbi:hypothetical protein HK103_002189 [Boothiomyces macroporosus]|uniref:Uncharacterized protein n=1 Tax=Boothiomyces macroporosus TaxID=261099 RepID=A0AAD5UAH7_9FUNG|nr:hypothetical protein HK103_002189 [Boothiomyces macroporosus]
MTVVAGQQYYNCGFILGRSPPCRVVGGNSITCASPPAPPPPPPPKPQPTPPPTGGNGGSSGNNGGNGGSSSNNGGSNGNNGGTNGNSGGGNAGNGGSSNSNNNNGNSGNNAPKNTFPSSAAGATSPKQTTVAGSQPSGVPAAPNLPNGVTLSGDPGGNSSNTNGNSGNENPLTMSNQQGSSSTSSLGLLIGGVVFAVVIIAGLGFIFVVHKRKSVSESKDLQSAPNSIPPSSPDYYSSPQTPVTPNARWSPATTAQSFTPYVLNDIPAQNPPAINQNAWSNSPHNRFSLPSESSDFNQGINQGSGYATNTSSSGILSGNDNYGQLRYDSSDKVTDYSAMTPQSPMYSGNQPQNVMSPASAQNQPPILLNSGYLQEDPTLPPVLARPQGY